MARSPSVSSRVACRRRRVRGAGGSASTPAAAGGFAAGRRGPRAAFRKVTPVAATARHGRRPADAARYRVEQDYRELKQEVGLAKFEGRGWRGFNHHVTLCLAAYGFLVCERSLSPLGTPPKPTRMARHNPYSIASLRHRIARMIMRKLDRCPYCDQPHRASQMVDNRAFHKML